MYSRLTYFAIKAEVTENTALKPDVFLGITALDLVTQYINNPSSPIFGDRNTKINPVKGAVDAPQGSVTVQIEPKGFGYFLKAVFGAVTSGRYFSLTPGSGTFVVGETVTGGTSAATGTVLAVSSEGDYMIITVLSGTFTVAGETITGGTSAATATTGLSATTVIGHEFKAPQATLPTFTVEIGYQDMAYRFTGVRFPSINSLTATDNIMTAEMAMFARAEYKFGRIGTATTSGSGTKVLLTDQTQGLVVGDSIKVFRPSTGAYIDLNGVGVKTNIITAISPGVSVSITVLTDATVAGDLIVLAPQTPSYSLAKELGWIGGSIARVGNTLTAAIAADATLSSIESFEMSITNEMEGRHAANATGILGRFPVKNHLKGFTGKGTLRKAFVDPTFLDRLRNATQTCMQIRHTGDQIGSTGLYYTLDWRLPNTVFQPWHPAIENDALLDEEMPFDFYRNSGYTAKVLLVTDQASY